MTPPPCLKNVELFVWLEYMQTENNKLGKNQGFPVSHYCVEYFWGKCLFGWINSH